MNLICGRPEQRCEGASQSENWSPVTRIIGEVYRKSFTQHTPHIFTHTHTLSQSRGVHEYLLCFPKDTGPKRHFHVTLHDEEEFLPKKGKYDFHSPDKLYSFVIIIYLHIYGIYVRVSPHEQTQKSHRRIGVRNQGEKMDQCLSTS